MDWRQRTPSRIVVVDLVAALFLAIFLGGCGLLVAAGAGAGGGYAVAEETDDDGEGALGTEEEE